MPACECRKRWLVVAVNASKNLVESVAQKASEN